ncbi:DUF881 domain-containing protein [uncultured Clostridium sp.]|uniref:DUF881 domain-containing protein n=1 Tax=uncultured Clostridium sp. TaxID=59620 RepID=UPI002606A1B5|nr:DUF881 domain-containing protein [uncultured Clostridium sp.]
MKKVTSQISIAVVCVLLGFLITYQFKSLTKKNENNYDKSDMITQIEGLQKQKDELEKTNKNLNEKLNKLEDEAIEEGKEGATIKNSLNNSRMILGLLDVEGPGVEITITPKKSLFGSNETGTSILSEDEIVHIVNLLRFTRAEAISINGYRVTPQTGIKNSKNYIWIGTAGQISPEQKIVIKAIGDKARLKVALNFPGGLDYGALQNYDCNAEEKDKLLIEKTTQGLKTEFLKPVNEGDE